MCVSNTEFEYGNFVDRSGNIKQNEHKKSNLNPKSKENLNQKTLVPQKTVNKIPSEKTEAKVIASQKKISGIFNWHKAYFYYFGNSNNFSWTYYFSCFLLHFSRHSRKCRKQQFCN